MPESRNDRTRHEDLARRIEPASTWADIAVGEQQLRVLRELADSAAHVLQVSEGRRSENKNLTDRGIIALFTGPSGTGARAIQEETVIADTQSTAQRGIPTISQLLLAFCRAVYGRNIVRSGK